MLLRRPSAALLALVCLAVTGCSGGDDAAGPGPAPATVTPSAVGDRPLVEVTSTGAEPRQVLALDLEEGTGGQASLVVAQEVVRDRTATTVPPVTVPFTVAVTAVDGDTVTTTRTYGEPTIDGTGLGRGEVAALREALGALGGTTAELTVRRDGTSVAASPAPDTGTGAVAQVDAQVRDLVPVLPTEAVGAGATWTATSVAEVGGATVDQVATYTLDSVADGDYVLGVVVERTYRPGEVDGVEVRSGRSTVTARLEGDLGSLLPRSATGNVSTQVSYVVDAQVTEVRTTVTLGLTSS